MAQIWSDNARSRAYIVPLAVALPTFFFLGCLAQGFFLLMTVENGWDSGNGNVWQELQNARQWVWVCAVIGGICGVCWAWIIILPLRRVQQQLEHFSESGHRTRLDVEHTSELSFLATAFNQAIEQVEKSLPKRAQKILGSITSGVVVIDCGGNVEWMNPYAVRLFHVPFGKFCGKPFAEVLSRSSELVDMVSRGFREKTSIPRESVTLTDQYGETRKLSAWMVRVHDEDGSPVGMVLTAIDESRLESFSSGIEGAEKASSLRHVATGIVHEIRNPLTPIRGLAQILASGKEIPPEKLKSYSKVIVEAVDRVNQVVDRFSMFSKPPEEGFAVTDLREILSTVEETVSHLARKAKVTVRIEPIDPDLHIPCKPKLLILAITNLVINGIEASPARGTVTIQAGTVEDNLVISVVNLGSSIPPGDFEDLFLPFHTTKKNGTGLGIPISDSIVKSHGGTLTVKSENNQTTFSISIPIQSKGQDGLPILKTKIPRDLTEIPV